MPGQYNVILMKDSPRLMQDLLEYMYDMAVALKLSDIIMMLVEFLFLTNEEEHAE